MFLPRPSKSKGSPIHGFRKVCVAGRKIRGAGRKLYDF